MRDIERLLSRPGRKDIAGLRELDADEVAAYAADAERPWYRRRACAQALAGRVPEQWVSGLAARVYDSEETTEVRVALLEALAGRAELLPWLRHEDRHRERSDDLRHAALKARGLLGDRSAAGELSTLASDPWRHQRAAGEAGLDGLVARHGAEPILADLGGERPEDRLFAVRMRHRAGADVSDALADPDRVVAHLAQSLLTDPDRLRGYLDTAPTAEAMLWAAYALHRLTGDTAETRAIYDALGRPRVEVDGLDDELRGAVLHEYAPTCQRLSDPRWRVEAVCAEPCVRPDLDEQLSRATAALTAAGLAPQPPVPCGEVYRQGAGTYHVFETSEDEVSVSSIGRFATGRDDDGTARLALETAGFRWIDGATYRIRVTDLCVYHFGDRGPLTIGDLLFYWQD